MRQNGWLAQRDQIISSVIHCFEIPSASIGRGPARPVHPVGSVKGVGRSPPLAGRIVSRLLDWKIWLRFRGGRGGIPRLGSSTRNELPVDEDLKFVDDNHYSDVDLSSGVFEDLHRILACSHSGDACFVAALKAWRGIDIYTFPLKSPVA